MSNSTVHGNPRRTSRYLTGGLLALLLSVVTLAAWRGSDTAVFETFGAQASSTGAASHAAPQQTARPPAVSAVAPTSANGARASYADVVDKVAPGVVTVRTEGKMMPEPTGGQMPDLSELFGRGSRMMPQRPRPTRGLGSGVIVSQDGYILTNHHVIENADTIRVELTDKRVLAAKLVGQDPATDLAVIKVTATGLPVVPMGNSDRVRVGDVVLAVGNPLNLGQTVTMGIVSAKSRQTGLGDGSFEDFLQTDAPINQGNSGGALVSVNGELVGINSQILSPSGGNIGVGFAIPVNMARSVMDQLVKDGKVHRSKLGIGIQNVTGDIAASLGLPDTKGGLVARVEADSPAARAGLREGDVILEVDGRGVGDSNELRNVIAGTRPGSTVSLKVLRDGQPQTVRATLGELEADTTARGHGGENAPEGGKFGMTVQPLTPDLAERLELPRTTTGLVVADVDPSGQAAASGLQPGDVIEKVNGKAVGSVSDLRATLDKATDKPALLLVRRGEVTQFLTLRAPNA